MSFSLSPTGVTRVKPILAAIAILWTSGCMLNTRAAIAPSPSEEWKAPAAAIHTSAPTETPAATPVTTPDAVGLDLVSAVDEALKNNPLTQKSWYDARAAAARRVQAASSFFPSLSAAENLQRQRIDTVGSIGGLPTGSSTAIVENLTAYGPILEINYRLFSFGADTATANAAKEALYAANFSFNRQLQGTVAAVQAAFYRLNATEAAVRAQEASLSDAQESYNAAQARNKVGLNPIQDLLKAESNLLQERYRLDATAALVENARANLARLLGRQDVGSVRIRAPELPVVPESLQKEVKTLIDTALEQRPDLQAAYSSLRATNQQKKATVGNLFPDLVGGMDSDFTKIRGFDGTEENYTAFLRLRWNIFDGFSKEYKVIEANANLESAKRDASNAELGVASDVWAAWHNFESAGRKLDASRSLIKATESTFGAIETGYNNGLNSILDLLSAQKDLANARLTLVQAEADYAISLAELSLATGEIAASPKS